MSADATLKLRMSEVGVLLRATRYRDPDRHRQLRALYGDRATCDHIRQYQATDWDPQQLPCAQYECPDFESNGDDWSLTLSRQVPEDGVGYRYEYHREERDGWYSWELRKIERVRMRERQDAPLMPMRRGTPLVRM